MLGYVASYDHAVKQFEQRTFVCAIHAGFVTQTVGDVFVCLRQGNLRLGFPNHTRHSSCKWRGPSSHWTHGPPNKIIKYHVCCSTPGLRNCAGNTFLHKSVADKCPTSTMCGQGSRQLFALSVSEVLVPVGALLQCTALILSLTRAWTVRSTSMLSSAFFRCSNQTFHMFRDHPGPCQTQIWDGDPLTRPCP